MKLSKMVVSVIFIFIAYLTVTPAVAAIPIFIQTRTSLQVNMMRQSHSFRVKEGIFRE